MSSKKYYLLLFTIGLFHTSVSFGQSFETQVLNKGPFFSNASLLQDYDSDGDIDLILTRAMDDTLDNGLEWMENIGAGNFLRHSIYEDDSLVRPGDIALCDCDDDGDLDYVVTDRGGTSSEPGQLYWLQRQDDDTYIKWTIESGADYDQVAVADYDGDGIQDIAAVGFSLTTVNLFRNDGLLNFSKSVIADSIVQAELIVADDIDDDGDVDIVFDGSRGRILWNTGTLSFEDGPELYTFNDLGASAGGGLAVTDLNNDGAKDILTFSASGTGGLYFLDGSNGYDQTQIDKLGIDVGGDLLVADIDGNGLLDIIRQHWTDDELAILYQESPLSFRREVLDVNWDNRGESHMSVGDIDSDGDLDLLFPENGNVDGDVTWYENIDGRLYRHHIFSEWGGALTVKTGDMDGDGDVDIVFTTTTNTADDYDIVWYENRGELGYKDWLVVDTLNFPMDIELADLDGDGGLDIVATARDDNKLHWFKRSGLAWEAFTIEENANQPAGVAVADLNGDGSTDVALASSADDKVYWYLNDGAGSFSRRVIDANLSEPKELEIIDLNEDGLLDVVVIATDISNAVTLYTADAAQTFTREIIASDRVPSDIEVGDWSGDGVPDIAISHDENIQADSDVTVLVNDGSGAFTSLPAVSEGRRVNAIRLADLDNDSDLDLVLGQVNQSTPMWVVSNDSGVAMIDGELLSEVEGVASISSMDVTDMNGDGRADIIAADERGNRIFLMSQRDDTGVATEDVALPAGAELSLVAENYPNPFRNTTMIRYYLPTSEDVELAVYDLLGRKVETLVNGFKSSGWHEQSFVVSSLPGGVYFYSMTQGDKKVTGKMIVLE